MTSKKIAALKRKGWAIDPEDEKALAKASDNIILLQIVNAMKNMTQDNQSLIKSAIENMARNNEAILKFISGSDESHTIVESSLSEKVIDIEPETRSFAALQAGPDVAVPVKPKVVYPPAYTEWHLLIDRDKDGFIDTLSVTANDKQWEFRWHRDSEGFVQRVTASQLPEEDEDSKQWEFAFKRNMDGFISSCAIKQL